MLQTPYLQALHNDEHIRFNKNVLTICSDSNPVTLNINAQFLVLQAGTELMEDAYLQMRASELTKKILDEDKVRDRLIEGIEKGAEFFSYHFNPDFVVAAERLLMHINKYGNSIARMNYQAETTALEDIIDSSKNDVKLNAAITLLGMSEWFVKLEESNIAFDELFVQRVKDDAGKSNLKLKELRKTSVLEFKELAKHLEANALLNPSALHDTVINEINKLVDKYNSIRRKRKNNGEDEPGE